MDAVHNAVMLGEVARLAYKVGKAHDLERNGQSQNRLSGSTSVPSRSSFKALPAVS